MYRIIAVLACTTLSFYGLFLPLSEAKEILFCLAEGSCNSENNAKSVFTIVSVIVFCTAWFLYFTICYKWIMKRPINKKIRIVGATFGCSCILMTAGIGLFFTYMSVGLIIHIYRTSPYA